MLMYSGKARLKHSNFLKVKYRISNPEYDLRDPSPKDEMPEGPSEIQLRAF